MRFLHATLLLSCLSSPLLCAPTVAAAAEPATQSRPLRIVVMDPLATPLSCACLEGFGQRDYGALESFLEKELTRDVEVTFTESLLLNPSLATHPPDVVIGKKSVVEFDARKLKLRLRPLAMLADSRGKTTLTALLLVRKADTAKRPGHLQKRKIVLGPREEAEAHAAAKSLLRKHQAMSAKQISVASSVDAALFAVSDGEADAAVAAEFMLPMMEACGKLAPGALRSIGQTRPVPFVCAFTGGAMPSASRDRLRQALQKVAEHPKLLTSLESKTGFHDLPPEEWTDWRGPRRDGLSDALPPALPDKPKVLWSATVTGPALAGVAATERYVVVPDKDRDLKHDIMRCFDTRTGKPLWSFQYPAKAPMEYTNAPRATPVIHEELVYLLGALGDLHCVELATGQIVWKLNLYDHFQADRLNWGSSSAPLVVDGLLIVNPGAKEASLAALDARTGKVVWKTPGHAAAYAAFVLGEYHGVRQIIGYDTAGLGGWDPATGKELWRVSAGRRVDYNVGTPVLLPDGVLVATENNATRFYRFEKGRPAATPPVLNDDLAPDSTTPVVQDGRIFCSAYGELFCVDLKNGMKTIWAEPNDMFYEHTNLIAGNQRVLIWTTTADLLLLQTNKDKFAPLAHLRPFGDQRVESMAHPALIGNRLLLRSDKQLLCLDLAQPSDDSQPTP